MTTLFEPPSGGRGSFPVGASYDVVDDRGRTTKRVFVGIPQNPDDPAAPLQHALLISDDGGETFTASEFDDKPEVTNLARLPSGTLVDVSFKAVSLADGVAQLLVRRSTDDAASWSSSTIPLDAPQPVGGFRLHRGIVVLADGMLLTPAYLGYVGETAHGVRLLESTDEGASWSVRSTIAAPSGNEGYNETAIAQVADGTLLAVMRTEAPGGHGPLMQSRSLDEGASWSAPTAVQVSFGGAAGPRVGVDPALLLLPNGVLALSGGRPDNWLAVDPSGTGESFSLSRVTYVNVPSTPNGASQFHGSSGYSALVELGSNRLLLVGDNCANSWGCPADEGGWTVDGEPRIWQSFVDVLTPDVGKIALAPAIAAGRVELGGTMTWSDPSHPEAGPAAAFDGSTATWSAAFADGDAPPQLVLKLDRIHELTRVGLFLRRGLPASATVYVSEDGDAWGEPIVVADDRTHHAIEYFDLPAGVRAGWLKVVGVPHDDCAPPLSGSCGVLGELELYSTIDGFENDALGVVPRGYGEAALARVGFVDDGGRALRIHDDSDQAHAKLLRRTTASTTKRLELRVRADALPNAMLIDVLGTTAAGDEVAAYHLAWTGDGSLRRYDAAAQTWDDVAGPGLADPSAWTTIRVLAATDGATLCVDGEPVATIVPSTQVVSLVGHGFASAGTAPVGDDVTIDDVLFDDATDLDCAIELPGDPPTGGSEGGSEGDGGSGGGADSGADGTSDAASGSGVATADDTAPADDGGAGGCGCRSSEEHGALPWLGAIAMLAGRRRRPRSLRSPSDAPGPSICA